MRDRTEKRRRATDEFLARFGDFFFQANVAHVVMLHASAMKAGFKVNGRKHFTPFDFAPTPLTQGERE